MEDNLGWVKKCELKFTQLIKAKVRLFTVNIFKLLKVQRALVWCIKLLKLGKMLIVIIRFGSSTSSLFRPHKELQVCLNAKQLSEQYKATEGEVRLGCHAS